MQNAVFVLSINQQDLEAVALPGIAAYAERCRARLYVAREPRFRNPDESRAPAYWEKLQCAHLLRSHNRLLVIDLDVLIRRSCPDLFTAFPDEDKWYARDERDLWDAQNKNLDGRMREMCVRRGWAYRDWDGIYFNAGVMLVSRPHAMAFYPPARFHDGDFCEQTWLNVQRSQRRMPFGEIGREIHGLGSGIVKRWDDAQIVHFAGLCPGDKIRAMQKRKALDPGGYY